MLYFPAAASATLALGIFVHPDHEQASSDLSLLHETVRFLSTISSREPGTYVDYVLSLCSEFENAAKRILRQCRRQETGMQGVSMDNAHGEPVAPINVDATDPQREDIIDSTLDWQWSIPPFWNWQDLMASIPGSPLHMDWDVSLDI
ncbi:hypothetical protein EYZ11_011450 [Aspergillus tanneri]|nr:hypothetical protein EYZ11_011450 [Aspergillus tanneri]